MGKKYFKGRIIKGERVLSYVVWDGVHNWKDAPPLDLIAMAEKMLGTQVHLKVDERAVEDIDELIAAPMEADPSIGGLVVWTRDHRTYGLIVEHLLKSGIFMV